MTYRFTILATLSLLTAFIATPSHVYGLQARLQAQAQEQHDHENTATANAQDKASDQSRQAMMAGMMAADATLGEMVQKMNAAQGADKTDAIAALLTALVQEHRAMRASMMTNMMNMMSMMGNMGAHGTDEQGTPKK